MKRILLALVTMASAEAGAAANGWALVTLTGNKEESASVLFGMDNGRVALFSKEECADRAERHILSQYEYTTQFEYLGGGAYDTGDAYGRAACIAEPAGGLDKYVVDRQYGDADGPAFFADFGTKINPALLQKDFASYTIFPADGDAESLGRGVDERIGAAIGRVQETSFDCENPDLGKADGIICHDAKLARLDLELDSLVKEANARDGSRFQDVKSDFKEERSQIFHPAGLEKLYIEKINWLRRKLGAG